MYLIFSSIVSALEAYKIVVRNSLAEVAIEKGKVTATTYDSNT